MSELLDSRHEAFCRFYLRGPSAGMVSDAYEAAGFKRDSGNASRLFRQDLIQRRIEELRAGDAALERQAMRRALAASQIDKLKVVQELAKVAFADISGYLDDSGGLDFKKIASSTGAAVRDLAIDCVTADDGKQKVTRLRLRLHDKHKALVELAHQINVTHEPPVPGVDDATPERKRERDEDFVIARLRDWVLEGRDVAGLVDVAVDAAEMPSWDWHAPMQRMKDVLKPSIEDPPEETASPQASAPEVPAGGAQPARAKQASRVAKRAGRVAKRDAVVRSAAKRAPKTASARTQAEAVAPTHPPRQTAAPALVPASDQSVPADAAAAAGEAASPIEHLIAGWPSETARLARALPAGVFEALLEDFGGAHFLANPTLLINPPPPCPVCRRWVCSKLHTLAEYDAAALPA
jgi:hypothetical protein